MIKIAFFKNNRFTSVYQINDSTEQDVVEQLEKDFKLEATPSDLNNLIYSPIRPYYIGNTGSPVSSDGSTNSGETSFTNLVSAVSSITSEDLQFESPIKGLPDNVWSDFMKKSIQDYPEIANYYIAEEDIQEGMSFGSNISNHKNIERKLKELSKKISNLESENKTIFEILKSKTFGI